MLLRFRSRGSWGESVHERGCETSRGMVLSDPNHAMFAVARSTLPKAERAAVRARLSKPTRAAAVRARPKAQTNLGHVLSNGSPVPHSPAHTPPSAPASGRAASSRYASPKTGGSSGGHARSARTRTKPRFDGLTANEFAHDDWRPSLECECHPLRSLGAARAGHARPSVKARPCRTLAHTCWPRRRCPRRQARETDGSVDRARRVCGFHADARTAEDGSVLGHRRIHGERRIGTSDAEPHVARAPARRQGAARRRHGTAVEGNAPRGLCQRQRQLLVKYARRHARRAALGDGKYVTLLGTPMSARARRAVHARGRSGPEPRCLSSSSLSSQRSSQSPRTATIQLS
jgi:hypothetical protein